MPVSIPISKAGQKSELSNC